MSLQRSIATPIQKPYTAKAHHLADGVCDAADDVAGAASTVAWITFAGACIASGIPNSGEVANICITGIVGAAATSGLARVFGKAARYVRDSTNVYASDISDKIASQFNQAGRGLAWVAPLTFVVAAGAVASHYLHKLPQIAPQIAVTAQPDLRTKFHVIYNGTDEKCVVKEVKNHKLGEHVIRVPDTCPVTIEFK